MNKKTSAIILIAALITTLGGALAADQAGVFNITNSNVAIDNSTATINNSNITIGENNTVIYPDATPTPTPDASSSDSSQTTTTPAPTPTPATITNTYGLNDTFIENGTYTFGNPYTFNITLTGTFYGKNEYQFIITEAQGNIANVSDAYLSANLALWSASGGPIYRLTANGNQLIATVQLSDYGGPVPRSNVWGMAFNASGTFNLGVNVIPSP
jgi:hypothetical protein